MINNIKKYLHKLYFEIIYFHELMLIRSYCSSYKISSYTIYSDLSVDITSNNGFVNVDFSKIPFKINAFYGDIASSNTKSFENYPKYVYGSLLHNNCCQLTSLIGSPIEIHGSFNLDRCNISSLDGSPRKITGNFDLERNVLSELKGCPKYVGGDFNIENNRVTTLHELNTDIGGRLLISNNYLPYEMQQYKRFNHIISKEYLMYKLWMSDGTFNKGRFQIFINDIKNGSLK